MKTKLLFLFTYLIIFSSFKPIQQSDDNQLYKVIIFKWVKNEKGEEQKKVVVIDQEGKIVINNQNSVDKINVKTFTKAINQFIRIEKIEKENANNDPPKAAIIPKNGEQYISVTIIKLKDFLNEKGFSNNSKYSLKTLKKSSDINIKIYKYLQSDDLKTLKKILDQ